MQESEEKHSILIDDELKWAIVILKKYASYSNVSIENVTGLSFLKHQTSKVSLLTVEELQDTLTEIWGSIRHLIKQTFPSKIKKVNVARVILRSNKPTVVFENDLNSIGNIVYRERCLA